MHEGVFPHHINGSKGQEQPRQLDIDPHKAHQVAGNSLGKMS